MANDPLNSIPLATDIPDDILAERKYAFNTEMVMQPQRQRLSQPTAGPKDLSDRVSAMEIMIENQIYRADTFGAELRNVQNDNTRHERILNLLHANSKRNSEVVNAIRLNLISMNDVLNNNTGNVQDILKHQLPGVVKSISNLVAQMDKQEAIFRQKYVKVEGEVVDIKSNMDDVCLSVTDYTKHMSTITARINDLTKTVAHIVGLINSLTLTKKIITRLTVWITGAITLLVSLYKTNALTYFAKWIVKLSGAE